MTTTPHELMVELLRASPQRCHACRKDLHVSIADECANCGEIIELDVDSTRQIKRSDPQAWPVVAAELAVVWWFIKTILPGVMGLTMLIQNRQLLMRPGAEASRTMWSLVSLLGMPVMPVVIFILLMYYRVRLLRTKLWVRIAVLVVVIGAHVLSVMGMKALATNA